MPIIHLSTEDMIQMTPNVFGNDEIKQENAEDTRDDSNTFSESQDDAGTEYFIKLEPVIDNAMPNFEEVPLMKDDHVQSNAGDIISLAVVKEEPSDVTGNTRDDSNTFSESQDDTGTEYFIKLEPVIDNAMPNFEEVPLMKDDRVQSNAEDIISLAVVKEEPSDVTGNDAAVEQGDTDLYHSALGLHSEWDIPVDIVKEEPRDVDIGAPRLAAQKYRDDNLLSNIKRTDQTIDKVEEPERETGRDIEDKPVSLIRLHTCDKTYECNLCKKCFNRRSHLNVHMRVHTGEKPYECNVCNKCFNLKSNLDRHIRTHTGEKPHQCNECKKCFNNSGHLNVHMRIHTGEKPYECNVCNKCFNEKGKLNTHMLTHTGEKPYECNVCKKCFNLRSNLQKHVRKHTGEKPYDCNLCKKCFHERSQLNVHMRIHTSKNV